MTTTKKVISETTNGRDLESREKVFSIDEEMLNNFPIKLLDNLFRTSSLSHETCTDAYMSVFVLFDLPAAINY